jgi:hypothetical protein
MLMIEKEEDDKYDSDDDGEFDILEKEDEE